MAGQLTIDTLRASSGVLATQNGMTGIAKAWVNFNGGDGNTAGVINGSFNVSSITVNGTGQFTVNYTTALPNANYVISGSAARNDGTTNGPFSMGVNGASLPTTTTAYIVVGYGGSRASAGSCNLSIQVNFLATST
jgi:hypothetical protein